MLANTSGTQKSIQSEIKFDIRQFDSQLRTLNTL